MATARAYRDGLLPLRADLILLDSILCLVFMLVVRWFSDNDLMFVVTAWNKYIYIYIQNKHARPQLGILPTQHRLRVQTI